MRTLFNNGIVGDALQTSLGQINWFYSERKGN